MRPRSSHSAVSVMPRPSTWVTESRHAHSPSGGRSRCTVRSVLMKMKPAQSSGALTPLPPSAASIVRWSGVIGSPSTSSTRGRIQTVAGPGPRKRPRANTISMAGGQPTPPPPREKPSAPAPPPPGGGGARLEEAAAGEHDLHGGVPAHALARREELECLGALAAGRGVVLLPVGHDVRLDEAPAARSHHLAVRPIERGLEHLDAPTGPRH